MPAHTLTRRSFGSLMLGSLAACAAPVTQDGDGPGVEVPGVDFIDGYGPIFDAGVHTLPPVPAGYTQGVNRRMTGVYVGEQEPGTIEVDPYAKFLYWIPPEGVEFTIRYPVGVGRAGLAFQGNGVNPAQAQVAGLDTDAKHDPAANQRFTGRSVRAFPAGCAARWAAARFTCFATGATPFIVSMERTI